MPVTVAEKRAAFRALHAQGCFVLPNPWDVGSARMLQQVGFSAIASTSAGFAWAIGKPDNAVTRSELLHHLAALNEAVDLPINADFESGFAADAEGISVSVSLAIEAGVSGLSIEDRDHEKGGYYDKATALERFRAARKAVDDSGKDVILVARADGLLTDASALTPVLDKLVAFAAEGADCLYAPGIWKKDDIATMVRAVAPKPVNVLVFGADLNVAELADLGVRRISVGGALATVGWGPVIEMAEKMKAGSFAGLRAGVSGKTLNGMFKRYV